MVSSNKLCLVLLTCVIFTALSRRLVLCGYIAHSCTNNSTTSSQSNQIEDLLASLASDAANNPFRYAASKSFRYAANDSVGLFLCRGDVAGPACSSCVAAASVHAGRVCPVGREAVIWYDECLVRYSDRPIYAVLSLHPMQVLPGNAPESGRDDDSRFTLSASSLAGELALEAAGSEGKRFMVGIRNVSGSTEAVYGAVQCTPDLSPGDCSKCFTEAIKGIKGPSRKILLPSCYIMYDLNLFFNATALRLPPSPPPGKPSKKSSVLVATVASLAGVGFLSALAFIFLRRRGKKKYNALVPQENCVNDMTTAESLRFDFRSIQIATNNFSDLNKLGRGGFGEVYKGILLDGREIAVKRLSKSSVQGEAEFKNEVMLVAKLQHRNLVRLFGFCLEGDEKLLVYEYVPNNSLDSILFDPKKQCRLNWSIRCNVVEGIARGVMYLHEDSRLKIIHRDLKASNILLDNNMNAKVSDFGMAKMFVGADQTQGNTKRIVGTYGYMAPEYAMEGLYSIKSDVYSFGVLLLEILSGRKNSSFRISDCAPSLVAYAWQLWNEKKALDLIDIGLKDSCHESELLRYINIGLLCVQEEALLRPSMSSVVLMLKSKAQSLSQPQRPAFIATTSNTTCHNEITAAVDSCSVNGMTVSDFLPR